MQFCRAAFVPVHLRPERHLSSAEPTNSPPRDKAVEGYGISQNISVWLSETLVGRWRRNVSSLNSRNLWEKHLLSRVDFYIQAFPPTVTPHRLEWHSGYSESFIYSKWVCRAADWIQCQISVKAYLPGSRNGWFKLLFEFGEQRAAEHFEDDSRNPAGIFFTTEAK